MNNKYVVGIGEALWDVFPEGKKLGGAPANFAYHVSQFGLNGMAVSAVGHDGLGDEILGALRGKQLNLHIQQVGYPTGTVQVSLNDKGVPQYNITEDVAWDNIDFTDDLAAIARDCCAVCFGSLAQRSAISRDTIERFLDMMPSEGTYRIFDINLRQQFYTKEVIEHSLTRCNVFKINDEELEIVSGMFNLVGDVESRCKELMNRYSVDILILTCGTDGSYIFTSEGERSFLPTPKVEVADTVGAGDSFTAAFIAGLLQGKSIADAHRQAVDLSAYVCSCEGAMPSHVSVNGK